MERDLVTGGTGLVGSFLICNLLIKGRKVRALKRASSDLSWFNNVASELLQSEKIKLLENLEWCDGDIADQVFVLEQVENCSRVFHTAALVSFSSSDQAEVMRTNAEGTKHVVNACLCQKEKPVLCHFSSTATIGSNASVVSDEENKYNPDDASYYAQSKYLAELEAFRGREEGLDVVIINPCIILGYGNWNTGPSKFFANAKNGFPFYTSGSNAFVDVRDVAAAAIRLLEQRCFDGRYLCTAHNLTYFDLFNALSSAFNSKPPRILVKPWMAGIAWRLAALASIFTGQHLITKASTAAGMQIRRYNSSRLMKDLSFEFKPFTETVDWHVNLFKRYHP